MHRNAAGTNYSEALTKNCDRYEAAGETLVPLEGLAGESIASPDSVRTGGADYAGGPGGIRLLRNL